MDGARLCLSIARTNASDLVSSGRAIECSLDSCALIWSVNLLRRTKVSSSAVAIAVLLCSLSDILMTAHRYKWNMGCILSKLLLKRAVLGV